MLLFSSNTYAISDHSISISTNTPTLESTVNNTADEEINIQKHEITINTNNPNGVKLFLSSKDNKTVPEYITNSGPATGSGSIGTSTIAESTGTISAPTKLSPNSFGFALDKNSSTIASNFSTSTIYESTNNTDKLTAKFTKLSNMHNLTEIHNISTTATNNKLNVYYGTNTNSLMREGKYEMDILYTIVSNTPTTDIPESNDDIIEINSKYVVEQTSGHERTVTTNIKSNVPIQEENIILTINNKPCTDIIITQNFTENTTKALSFTCKLPANDMGKYDINLKIPKLNINTIKTNAIEYIQAMQNFTYDQCTSMTEHQEKILGDKRDGELYTMAKLKDGKCWMTQNLRYQLSTTTPLTPADSDVRQNWTPNRSTDTTLTSAWSSYPEGYKTVRSYYDSTKPEYGVYYTHTAATAGTDLELESREDNARGSVCPKSWRLPVGSTRGEYSRNDFYMMSKHYKKSNTEHELFSGAPKYVLSGYLVEGTKYYIGRTAEIQSSTIYEDDFRNVAFSVDQNITVNSGITINSGVHRMVAMSVRCVAREPKTIGDLKFMQDITPEYCANSREHQMANLIDKRDGNTYSVIKLRDGKCWMRQNLRLKLDASRTLTSETSDVWNWTPPESTRANCDGAWGYDRKIVRSCFRNNGEYNNGVYYTHTAAIAATEYHEIQGKVEADESICPSNWRLPRTGVAAAENRKNDFYMMEKPYVDDRAWSGKYWASRDINFTRELAGFMTTTGMFKGGYKHYEHSQIFDANNSTYWWSSTVDTVDTAYNSYITPVMEDGRTTLVGGVIPRGKGGHRNNGYFVRCVAY